MTIKKVKFNDNSVIYKTYSFNEYDRGSIDSILYQKCYQKISEKEWFDILKELSDYKRFEMIVHINNLVNNF